MTLQDFVNHQSSRWAELSASEVLALRFYTTSSFPLFNRPMRQKVRPHPLAMCVYHLAEGLKKLRGVSAREPTSFAQVLLLWRGMKNMLPQEEFLEQGGTELAPMSTTADKDIALHYANSEMPLLFEYKARGLGRGCSIQYLSVFPGENEYLSPPLTYLLPEGPPTVEYVPEGSQPHNIRVFTVSPSMP
mmetsp:Transcript_54097/g.110383  ORF Transcript_54097/g.110383 Transcript_54097/m.110383 type:complete len:189 (+) Transcript_54097:1004-1570(+)